MDTRHFNPAELSVGELAELIEYHNHRYWELGEPEIPDERYDELLRALARLAPDHPLLNAVNAPAVATLGKVRHLQPMLSLDKAYSLEEVLAWVRKTVRSADEVLLVEPKYDGISAYFDGRQLSTRGDGLVGEDISDKVPLIELEAPGYRGPLERPVRGEIVIRDDDFRTLYSRIRRKNGGLYKNSRNAVAGIMGLKDASDLRRQGAKLTLVDYNLISHPVPADQLEREWPQLVQEMEELPYPLDGIVLRLQDEAYFRSLGNTAHHPRGAIAFKFTNLRRQSRIVGVEWSFGKNCLTPVAELEPIELGGITIRRASLHNVQNLIDKDLQIGDLATVERAGDVIPYIVSAEPGSERRSMLITHCPGCGARLERRGPELCCPNPECFETRLQQLLAAVKNLGIERLGEPNLRRIMQKFQVRQLRQLFDLTPADFRQLEGFAEVSAENLYREIQKARTVNDFQVLAALNIPHVGLNIAKLLLSGRTLAQLRQLSEEELCAIPGIGPERARALATAFRDDADLLDELLGAVRLLESGGSSSAPTICFTGKMPEKRSHYEALARAHGYEPVDDVTRELKLLVAADPADQSGKLKKARAWKLKILSLEAWLAQLASAPEPATAPASPPPDTDAEPEPPSPAEQLSFDF